MTDITYDRPNLHFWIVSLLNCHFEQFIGSALHGGPGDLVFPRLCIGQSSNWVYAVSTSHAFSSIFEICLHFLDFLAFSNTFRFSSIVFPRAQTEFMQFPLLTLGRRKSRNTGTSQLSSQLHNSVIPVPPPRKSACMQEVTSNQHQKWDKNNSRMDLALNALLKFVKRWLLTWFYADFPAVPYLGVSRVRRPYTCPCKMGTGWSLEKGCTCIIWEYKWPSYTFTTHGKISSSSSSSSQSSPKDETAERLRSSLTGWAMRTRTMRQPAMIYPTFTPASTSSVVSSAFDTSHAPELPTGQTACWRLIFTRLATDLFSLGPTPTYFHSAGNLFLLGSTLTYFHSTCNLFSLGSTLTGSSISKQCLPWPKMLTCWCIVGLLLVQRQTSQAHHNLGTMHWW